MKFCKDCKYLDASMFMDDYMHYCSHPSAVSSINPVSGSKDYNRAVYMRASLIQCGPEAKLFEQKVSWFKKWFQK